MREKSKEYYFDMEGSGHWAVLHFRNESDESGAILQSRCGIFSEMTHHTTSMLGVLIAVSMRVNVDIFGKPLYKSL
jgi:hypothetical protein